MKKLALLLSLLALGALGLAACGGGNDDEATAASETETETTASAIETTAASETDPERKPCGTYGRYGLAVLDGAISCRAVRRVIHDYGYNRLPSSWTCIGPDGRVVCTKEPGVSSRTVVRARFDLGIRSRRERVAKLGNEWAPLFAKDALKACRYMRWVACKGYYDYVDDPPPDGDPSGFQKYFANATVERVVIEDPSADPIVAAAKFSNGELVEFLPAVGRISWLITNLGDDLGKERLSDEQLITKRGNEWAPLFAEGGFKPGLWRYMGQPVGERMVCERAGHRPIKNCTPPSPEFRESFADATVERVAFHGRHAMAEFSNGESVEFEGPGSWFVTEAWIKKVARRSESCGIIGSGSYQLLVKVSDGNVPCRVARRVFKDVYGLDSGNEEFPPGQWYCSGPEGYHSCTSDRGRYQGEILARFQ